MEQNVAVTGQQQDQHTLVKLLEAFCFLGSTKRHDKCKKEKKKSVSKENAKVNSTAVSFLKCVGEGFRG